MRHKHIWRYEERGYGEAPKQNTPVPILFAGRVAECACGLKMFFPDDPELLPVEIDRKETP